MKPSLIELSFENVSPGNEVLIWIEIVSDFGISLFEEDLTALILESEFEIEVKLYGLAGGLIIKSIFIDFYFGFGSFSGDDGGGEELSGFAGLW